jgi:hypothetical protein
MPDKDHPLFIGRVDAFAGKTLEQRIQELADREEIRELIATYAHRMAHGPAASDLFTDDGVYINRGMNDTPPSETRGRAALDRHYGDRTGWAERPMPMIHNQILEVNGDEAHGICSVEIRLAAKGESIIASGYYQDRFRRVDGRWLFAVRDITLFHWVPIQRGWAKPVN